MVEDPKEFTSLWTLIPPSAIMQDWNAAGNPVFTTS